MIRSGGIFLCLLAIAGCSSNNADMAWHLMERQKEEQALLRQHEADQSRAQAPEQKELMLTMIREAQRNGRFFASLAYIDAYIAQFGASPQLRLLKADALRATQNHASSEHLYRGLLKTDQEARARHGLGLLAGEQGEYALAVQELTIAARLQPTHALLLSDLGYAKLRAGDIRGARLPLGQAAELEPENGTIISNLVLFLLMDGDQHAAERIRTKSGMSETRFQAIHEMSRQIQSGFRASVHNDATAVADTPPTGQRYIGHTPLLQ